MSVSSLSLNSIFVDRGDFFIYSSKMSDHKIYAARLSICYFFMYALLGYFLPSLVDMFTDSEGASSSCLTGFDEDTPGVALVYKLYVGWVQLLPTWVCLILTTLYWALGLFYLARLLGLSSTVDRFNLAAALMVTICLSMLAVAPAYANASVLGIGCVFVALHSLARGTGHWLWGCLQALLLLCVAQMLLEWAVVYFTVLSLLLVLCQRDVQLREGTCGRRLLYALPIAAVVYGGMSLLLPQCVAVNFPAWWFSYDLLLAAFFTMGGAGLFALIALLRRRWCLLLAGLVIWPSLLGIFSAWELMWMIPLLGIVTSILWTLSLSGLGQRWERGLIIFSCLLLLSKLVAVVYFYLVDFSK